MKSTGKILIYIDVMERYYFFRKFFKPLTTLGYEPVVVTARLSIWLRVKAKGFSAILLKKNDTASSEDIPVSDLQTSLSVMAQYHTLKEARRLYKELFLGTERLCLKERFEAFFIWNGTTTFAKALSDVARKYHIRRYYFEISNLGAKVFVDREGVNAQSRLAKSPEILDDIPFSPQKYREWKHRWQKNYTLPKQVRNRTNIPYSFVVDWFGFTFLKALREDRRNLLRLLKQKRMLKKHKPLTLSGSEIPDGYIFYVMQVSNDSQILLNSDVDNEQGLEIAKDIAREHNLPLVVKLHPAETDPDFIGEVEKRAKEGEFILSNVSTPVLIKNATKVVVINSTAGIEAMILGKEVITLGRTYYASFTPQRLQAFILEYLVDIDYFDKDESIDTQTMTKVLTR